MPSPLSKTNPDYYPLTLVLSSAWIFAYSYIIVWFTYDVTVGLGMPFSIIPMLLYPFGVAIREQKKFADFRLALDIFERELPDQELSLAETYAPQIFQMTGLAGSTWLLFTLISGTSVQFVNETIQYQLPLLIGVVLMKYAILAINRFKTYKSLFWWNVFGYILFLIIVLILDFKDLLFGA